MPTTMPTDLESLTALFAGFAALGTAIVVMITIGIGVLGLAILLWGRHVHRALLVLIAFPMGMGLGAILADKIQLNVWLGVLAVAISLTILVIVLARVVWALLAGLWLAAVAAGVAGMLSLGAIAAATQPGWNPTGQALAQAAWGANSLAIVAAGVGAGVAGLILGLFLPRATVIAATSMIGASLLSNAVLTLTSIGAPAFLNRMLANPWLLTGISAGILLLGVIYQSIGEVRAKRALASVGQDDAPADIRQPPPRRARG